MPKILSETELENLKAWLMTQRINPHKIHREFSDCVAVANILKKFFPKYVELHNYPPRNSTSLKINNWETLNFKVLNKLGLHQTKTSIEKLARATPGAIETLLYEIMMLDQVHRNKDNADNDSRDRIWTENDEVIIINVNKRVGDAIVQIPQKMILYSIYEEKAKDAHLKESYLAAAHQKIAHLENIIRLKAERIDELCEQLSKISVKALENSVHCDSSTTNVFVGETNSQRSQADKVSGSHRSNF